MDNLDLEKKIKSIVSNTNMFDAIIEAKKFEKDYKCSAFYKETKMSLAEVIKNAKLWYSLNLEGLTENVQRLIDSLNVDNLLASIEALGQTFEKENKEIIDTAKTYKDMVN